ncbi:MAG: ATP-binding cassette domain-containing protein [Prevotellaceae bacterium]|jgi:subfamily B ATP-binding cassette protein MsbA|nr:ATP-binding cassette domain-containing protein [Prevotellaceae bacterium]
MNKFFRLLSFAKPYSAYWPKYITVALLAMVFGVFNFALIVPILEVIFNSDDITRVEQLPDFSFTVTYIKEVFYFGMLKIKDAYGTLGSLVFVGVALTLASFLANLFKYIGSRVLNTMRANVMRNMRGALYDKITKLHVAYYNTQRKGNLLSVLSNDVNEVQASVVSSFQVIFRDPIFLLGNLAVLFYMSYQLTIITLITLPLSAYLIGLVSKKLRRQAREVQALQGDLMSMIEETVGGSRIIKAFNAQRYVRERFAAVNNAHRNALKQATNRQDLAVPMSEFFGVMVVVLILFMGGVMLISGNSTLTSFQFIAYLAFYYQILVPAKDITKAYAGIQRGMASADRIFDILDTPIAILKDAAPLTLRGFERDLKFNNVSFAYNEELVLKNINLTISKGKMVALVGQSGAGKTTIADLIPRFYDVTKGAILLDGVDIRRLQPKELMSLMGIVTQEAILFNDTIKNNIAFGLDNVPDEAVVEAAKVANAHEFILQTEHGYDTNIGDRGTRLSGGQRQRIAIARAVLKNPPILILDEATSALDTESEKLVQDALAKLMKNRTSIVIAHRLSTIQNADCIVVLQQGEIVEQGAHEELMKREHGVYRKLCELQGFK